MDKDGSALFSHKIDRDIFVCQIYIDDIIFVPIDQKVLRKN